MSGTPQNKRLSPFFNLEDFVFSETALKNSLNNWPDDPAVVGRLKILCEKVLDPLALHYKTRPQISSGFRCKELNAKVGGVADSQHQYGYATDFEFPDHDLLSVARWMEASLPFDQLLLERAGAARWIHVSYVDEAKNRSDVKWYDGKNWHLGLPDEF